MDRIAWFSSFAPNLKSSFFSRQVLPLLKAEVECFVGDEDLECELEFPKFHYLRAFLRHREKPFTHFIYHIEDHQRASFVERAQSLLPGITYLHDINLNRMEISRLAHGTTGALLNDKMDELYGEDSERLGDLSARGLSIEVYDKTYPQGEQAIRGATIIAVTNARALQELTNKGLDAPIELCQPAVHTTKDLTLEREQLRKSLKIESSKLLITMGGRFAIEDRFQLCLSVLSRLENTEFLWILADKEAYLNAKKALQGLNFKFHLKLANSEDEYLRAFQVADIALGLKFDALRGVSPAILSALAAGVPTVVSDFGPSSELPAIRVPVGESEEPALEKVLRKLVADTSLRESVSRRARAFAEEVLSPSAACLDLETMLSRYTRWLESRRQDRRVALFAAELNLSAPLEASKLSERALKDFAWGRNA